MGIIETSTIDPTLFQGYGATIHWADTMNKDHFRLGESKNCGYILKLPHFGKCEGG
jgi:hypothetical protein